MAFRFGGEEFAVVLPGADSRGALTVAETIRKAIETTEVVGTAEGYGQYRFGIHTTDT